MSSTSCGRCEKFRGEKGSVLDNATDDKRAKKRS